MRVLLVSLRPHFPLRQFQHVLLRREAILTAPTKDRGILTLDRATHGRRASPIDACNRSA
jgi:hypothetical protein